MKLHLPVKLRASLLAAVIAVPALLYGKAFAGTGYVAPSNEFGWDTNDITLNQRYNQTAGNTYTATLHSYDVYEMYGDGVNAKVRVGYTDETYATKLVYQGGQYGTVSDGVFTPYTGEVYFNKTGHKDDTASIIVKAEAPDQASGKHTSYMDGGGTFTSEEMVFENSLKSGSDTGSEYKDGASIVTDAIKVNNGYKEGSVVVLEDVNVETKTEGATMQTALQSDTQLVILNGNDNGNAKLTDDEKDTLNIVNVENNNAYDNNTVRTVELGEVKGVSDDEASPNKKGGSLVIVGNKERTEATKNEQGAITQGAFVDAYVKDDHVDVQITSVDNLAELSAANANLSIEEDVNNVNTTTLVNSVTTVGGSLSSLGIKVNGESTLTAKGDIKNIIGQGATSTQIDGQVISKEGEISLTNGSVNEGAIVRAESASQGDVTLSNIESEKAAEISAGHDLTLTENTVVNGVQEITIGNDLTVETGSKLTNYEGSIVAPGNITVSDDSSISDIGGNVEAGGDLSLEGDSSISGVDGSITAGGEGSTEGNITVSDGSSISGVGGNVEASGDLSLDNSSLTDVTGTVDVDGDMSVQNGSKVDNLGGLDVEGSLTIDNSTVTDVANGEGVVGEVGNGNDGDSLTIQNGGSLSNSTLNVNGDIIVDGATLTSSTITATGKLEATNGAVLSKGEVDDGNGGTVVRDNVLTVAQDSVITSGSQVSGTDLTVTSETGDPNLEISGQKDGHATTVTGDTNLKVDGEITVDKGAELSLDGLQGESGKDASLTATSLKLGELADNKASISNGTVAVTKETNIKSGNTFALSSTTGTLGSVVEGSAKDSSDTKLEITDGSEITASGIGTEAKSEGMMDLDAEYFDQVVVDGDSSLTVKGTAAIADYDQGGSDTTGSKTTIDGDAWLANASITGTGTYDADQGTETTLKSDAHIGSLTIAKEGALSFVGADNDNKTESYIARLTQTSDGHINVVNSVLKTPELHGENISLGLNGGTVVLDQVNAEDGATVPSVDLTNAHVLVGEITNASATGAPDKSPHGQSTIQTTVNRVTSEYSFSKGDPATATVKTYVFIARKDGTVTVNGQEITVVAGQEVEIADTYLNEATEYSGEESVSTGVTTVDMAEFIADNQDLLDPKLVGVVDGDGNPVCDKDGHQLMAQVIEKGEDLTYYPDAQQSLGTLTEVSDGIASLTVKGDFDADNTLINAYLTGTADENDHVIADADSGLITIEGVLSGQDNTLNADVDVSIGGIVSKDGAAYEAANKVTALKGDIAIGEEGIVGSSNVLSATNGKITVTGAIEGNSNDLDAKLNIETGSITGDDNMLTSETGSITTGAITGDSNMLTSTEGSITTGAIDGDSNDLDAKLNIVTGSITGDSNVLDSETGSITTGAIVGNSNDLDAVESITVNGDIDGSANDLDATGNITVHGSIITGGLNEETGNKLTSAEGSITVDNGISGHFNDLNAKLDITTGPISGNSNTLTSLDDSITVNGDISGNSNVLDAKLDITTGSISGSSNTLTSSDDSITVKGDISGDSNNLNAKLDIEAGDVSGDENVLIAGNEIHVEAVSGSDNDLTAGKDLMVETDIIGDGNDLTSVDGGVYIDGQLTGNTNQVKGETIEIGSVTGTNQKVLSYGAGLSPDDVAIHIGEFNAQGSTVAIATGTDPVMGQASGNGAIVIDSMTSVGEGLNTGMQNTISSNISSVYIGSLNDYDAYTLIEAHDDIVVGSLVGTHGVRSEGDKAFNQTWKAENLIVNSANGLTLVNSVLTMTGSISGGDLTLELEQPADGTIYVTTSSANSVTLNSLTLVNGAQLRVLGKADIESLTLDGKYSALDATTTEITELTLANGASYNAGLVIVDTLNIDNSSMSVVTLAGVKEISLVDNAVLAITGVDGKTDLTGDLSVDENSKLLVTFDLKTKGSITSSNGSLIQAANITAGDGLVSDGGTIKTTSGDIIAESGAIAATQGGTIEAVGNITAEDGNITADNGTIYTTGKISAEKGNLIASNGSELTAGKGLTALGMEISGASTVVGNVTLTGTGESSIEDASRVEGSITLSGGGNITVSGTEDGTKDAEVTGSITGATNATLTNATVGNLTASGEVSLTNADTGWIKDAASVSMADASTVTGDITMAEVNTGVTMDHSTLQGSIIGAIGATLENASLVTGNLDLAGGAATITASTVQGNVTGAETVTVSAGSTVGNISEVSGKVDIDDSTTGNIATSGDVELTNAHSGTISGTDVTLTNGSSSGAITAENTVTVNGSEVQGTITAGGLVDLDNATAGDIEKSGSVDMDNSTVGNVTSQGLVDLNGSHAGTISGADVTLTNGSSSGAITATGSAKVDASTVEGTIGGVTVEVTNGSTSGAITAVDSAKVENSTVDGTILAGGLVDLDNATVGNVTSTNGLVDLNGSHAGTISGADVVLTNGSSSGAITAVDSAKVENSTVEGTISAGGLVDLDNATVGDVTSTDGTVDLNGSHAGTISGADVVLTNGSSSGAITASGTAKVDGSTVEGTIGGTVVSVTGGSTTGAITSVDSAKVENSEVDGTITAGGLVDLDNATVGNVTSTNGTVDLNGSHAGTISGADVTLTNGSSSGAITATTGAASVTDSTVEGDISAEGVATVTGSTVEGTISGTDVTVTGGSTSGAITASGTAKVENSATGSIDAEAGVTVTGSTVEGTISGTDVSLTDSESGNIEANGDVILSNADTGAVSGATSLEMSNGAVVNGDVSMADGNTGVTMDGSTIHGSISNAGKLEITNQSMVTGNVELVGDAELSISDSTVAGTVTGAKSVELTNTSTGDVSVEDKVKLDNADTGSINANSLESINGSTVTGNVTLTGGAADLTDTVVTGSISGASEATLIGSTVGGSVSAKGTVTLDNADTGSINANSLIGRNDSFVTGDVTLTGGSANLTDTVVTGSITGAGEVTLVNAQTGAIEGDSLGAKDSEINGSVTLDGGNAELSNTDVAGDITGAADVTMSAGLVGSIGASGNVSLTEVSSTGTVVAGGSVSLNASQTGSVTGESLTATNASTVSGDVTLAGGDATVTDSTVTGAITGAGDVTLSNAQTGAIDGTSLSASAGSTVTGDVTLAGGDATVTDSIVTGSITGAGNVTVDQSTTGDITGATGDVALSDALVGTVQTAGDLSVDGTVKSDGSVSSDGLSVAEFGSLTAQGDVTADGLITIDGALTSTTGSVSLTGAEGSSISADVTAGKDVTLGGTIAAQDSTVTGENIVVNGTLNAAEGVALNGTVSGLGTINKTGGDDLVLAADTNMSGGAVNVSDGSTLKAEGGHMGSLAVTEGSTLVVGGDSEVATEVKADSLTMDASSTLQSTVNLAAGAADRVTVSGTTDLGGATLVLDGLKSSEEGAVADGTRFTVVQGSLQNSGLAEDVVHDLDKLNAHVENFGDHSDLVLSKNYKGADKTPNQTQVAGALASIDPEAVAGTQLGEVLDALAHTRSEADAKAALDSLGGAGLTAMQKMIADESHEHMQTFRSTFSSLSSGIDRRIDASGSIIPGVNSSAVTVTMTGGVTDVSGDQNIGDYRRSSCGFMLAGAHAVTENWTFGADFAYSAVTGKCTGIDVDADAYFVDLAMRYDNKRFHQMATLGAGFFGFDTKRFVSVKAQGHDFSGIADGSTTAASFNISYEASYDLIVSEDGHHVFSPVVMAEASFAQIKGMTEGGIGNAGLYSEADDVQSLTVGAGARYTFVYGEERNPGFISAEALAMGYAGDDSMTVRNAFIGGGPYFELKGPKAGNAGLRLNLNFLHPLSDKWSVTGNATAEFRSGQSGVGGAIGVKYSF